MNNIQDTVKHVDGASGWCAYTQKSEPIQWSKACLDAGDLAEWAEAILEAVYTGRRECND